MRDLDGREDTRGNLLILVGCLAVALAGRAMPETWAQGLAATIRLTALRPVVLLAEKGAANNASRFAIQGVQRQRDSLALMVQAGAVTRRENENLRELMQLRHRLSQPYIAAEVLHRSVPTDSRTLLIGAGANDGVRPFDPIVSPEGLLGYVWYAGPRASTVMTWAHPEFRASAVTADGRVLGMVLAATAPEGRRVTLQLTGVALRDSLPIGTEVFTAGLGGVYPRGVPIGRVMSIGDDPLGYERVYRIAPFANPGASSHVLVLSEPRDSVYLDLPAEPDSIAVPAGAVRP